ncbi:ankyrin [Lophiostoma macrostomum CBS 122681]|uniref:Ankyrin n=1 Tax=Lophiostoma macrostomum CBS 122681 TaxID=1314788 RepID=A0A6A6TER0_9PLEO|nr:ankyrin [Lophiostoma macrostomum CBS 122681]
MSGITLDEDAIDEILYLARANETSDLGGYLSELSSHTKHAQADLIAAAVDPFSKNTALHYAAANGHVDVVKVLLSHNLDKVTTSTPGLINAVNEAGNTALHWAALNGHLECVKLLIQLGADVTIINKAGHDAVFEAEINDKKEVGDWLLAAVDGLEKGVGSAEEGTPDHDEHTMDVGEKSEAKNTTVPVDDGARAVEEVRKQVEAMQTRDETSQDG